MEKSHYWSFTPCYSISSHIKLHGMICYDYDIIWYDSACPHNRSHTHTYRKVYLLCHYSYFESNACDRSVSQSVSQCISQSVSLSEILNQSVSQSVTPSVSQRVTQLISDSVSQWISDWLTQSAFHSVIGIFIKIALSNNYVWLISTSLLALPWRYFNFNYFYFFFYFCTY